MSGTVGKLKALGSLLMRRGNEGVDACDATVVMGAKGGSS